MPLNQFGIAITESHSPRLLKKLDPMSGLADPAPAVTAMIAAFREPIQSLFEAGQNLLSLTIVSSAHPQWRVVLFPDAVCLDDMDAQGEIRRRTLDFQTKTLKSASRRLTEVADAAFVLQKIHALYTSLVSGEAVLYEEHNDGGQ